jgi:hypothetical protein
MNISATRGSRTMLRKLSMRLFPRRSGMSETRRIAARRAVEAFRAVGREREERRRLDQSPIRAVDVIDLLGERVGQRRLGEHRLELFGGRDQMLA